MKPPVFDYYDPDTEDAALALLARFGPEAKLLAGGQSLMPLLNMRLLQPANLIDINRLGTMAYIRETPETLHIGALTRQRQVERSASVTRLCPLLGEALRHVGCPQIRHRGTLGGSLAHADPAAELPAVMAALEARFEVRSQRGRRTLTPETFFVTYLTTALQPDELLCEVRLPRHPRRTGWSFQEVCRVSGAFAVVGAAALLTLDDAGRCARARLAFTGVGAVPQRAATTEAALAGERLTPARIAEAAQTADAELDPDGDLHGSAAYRRHLARVLAQRTLSVALQRARDGAAEEPPR